MKIAALTVLCFAAGASGANINSKLVQVSTEPALSDLTFAS
jgi:hypothetical protein